MTFRGRGWDAMPSNKIRPPADGPRWVRTLEGGDALTEFLNLFHRGLHRPRAERPTLTIGYGVSAPGEPGDLVLELGDFATSIPAQFAEATITAFEEVAASGPGHCCAASREGWRLLLSGMRETLAAAADMPEMRRHMN